MSSWLLLLLVVALIAANGLFVAAEFSLVAARRGAIEERAQAGERLARVALRELKRLSFVLSAAQFGITASSLVVGFLAERAVGDVVVRPLLTLLGVPQPSSAALALTIAFLLSTVVQMVVGELAPKNLAIARPEPVAFAVALPMHWFAVLFGPVIRVFDRAAAWVARTVFRVEIREELLGGHPPDELARIIAASRQEGALSELQGELMERAVELGDRRVHEIMVPRPDVVFLPADAPLTALRDAARRTGHSRFPVRGETDDDIIGTVHIKDLLHVPPDELTRRSVGDLAAPALVVPESERLRRLLGQLRHEQRTFAVVVDEYGGTAGIVTVEDVLEQLVGEIEDEFDRDAALVRRVGPRRYLVSGALRIDRASALVGLQLPEGDYETIAGFVIDQLGHIPAEGELLSHDGWELAVSRVEGVRIAELTIRRLDDEEGRRR